MCVRVQASTSTSTVSLLSPTRRSLYLNLCHLLIERLRPPLLFTSSGHTALTYMATAGTAKRPSMARAAQRSCADSAFPATKNAIFSLKPLANDWTRISYSIRSYQFSGFSSFHRNVANFPIYWALPLGGGPKRQVDRTRGHFLPVGSWVLGLDNICNNNMFS